MMLSYNLQYGKYLLRVMYFDLIVLQSWMFHFNLDCSIIINGI
jgi:hypothetical protein